MGLAGGALARTHVPFALMHIHATTRPDLITIVGVTKTRNLSETACV